MHTAAELGDELRRLRRVAAEAAEECGAVLLAVGLPPDRPARISHHRHTALSADRRSVRHGRARAGNLRLSRPCRGARSGHRGAGVQPVTALAASAAGVERELGGVPQRGHRLRELAQHPVGPLAHRRAPAAPGLGRRLRRDCCDACRTPGPCSTTAWSIGTRGLRPNSRPWRYGSRTSPPPPAETVLLATLVRRAAVMTALTEIRCGEPQIRIPEPLLRAKYWRSARDGLDGYSANAIVEFLSIACPRRWTNSANTITPLPNWTLETTSVTAATGRCGSAGRGAQGRRRRRPRRGRRGHPANDRRLHQRQSRENLAGRLRSNRCPARR